MAALSVLACGMVTGVGLTAAASCAAIRGALSNFTETRFMDQFGEWIIGSQVPLPQPHRGVKRLVHLVVPAIREVLAAAPGVKPEQIPLLLCAAEKERPGRIENLDEQLLGDVQRDCGIRFHGSSALIAQGRVGGAVALEQARRLLENQGLPLVIVAGTDSFLVGPTLTAYDLRDRLLTAKNSNGFLPGEAGAAVLVGGPGQTNGPELRCLGIGFAQEPATIEAEQPLRADGYVQAIRAALKDAACTYDAVDYRLTDISGEQHAFKEVALAMTRTLRVRKAEFELHHLADRIGEVGAAVLPCMLAVARTAARKGYAPGKGVLGHLHNDSGERAVLVLRDQ
jgi:3-oxoacyl-[acyl-carrier-protein] synthase-1